MFNITDINELAQWGLGGMSKTMNGKLHVKVRQVDDSKRLHTLWPMKISLRQMQTCFCWLANYCMKIEYIVIKKKVILDIANGNAVLGHQIKIWDGWVAGVKFLWGRKTRRLIWLKRSLIQKERTLKSYMFSSVAHHKLSHELWERI